MARRTVLRVGAAAGLLAAAALIGGWAATAPRTLPPEATAGWDAASADLARGERLYRLGGCASCHAAPGAEGDAEAALSGGRRFETAFGVFVAPNISPHPDAGIGAWDAGDFASALLRGVSPTGSHYYPAFPWPSYARMEVAEALDLYAYLRGLPADATPSAPHELGLPWNIRAGIGLWKALYLRPEPVVAGLSGAAERGRALAEGAGHCGECHTPRDALGGPDYARWLEGGPNPDGPGRIPDITPGGGDIAGWSEADIAYYLESGFTPDYDSVGGSMAAVVENTARLRAEDRAALAAYLKAIPASR